MFEPCILTLLFKKNVLKTKYIYMLSDVTITYLWRYLPLSKLKKEKKKNSCVRLMCILCTDKQWRISIGELFCMKIAFIIHRQTELTENMAPFCIIIDSYKTNKKCKRLMNNILWYKCSNIVRYFLCGIIEYTVEISIVNEYRPETTE